MLARVALWMLMQVGDRPLPDSMQLKRLTAVKPAFNIDFRNSFLQHQPVNVWGVNAGIQYGRKRHQLTLGYYWLTYATYLRLINWQRDAAKRINLSYYTRTDLWFLNLLYWRNFTNNQRWMVSLPVEVGGGVAYAMPHDLKADTVVDRTRKNFFVPIQLGGYVQWKASRWVGLNAQMGYRYALFRTDINQQFNGLYYSIGVNIYLAFLKDIWGAVRYHERISPIRPPVAPKTP